MAVKLISQTLLAQLGGKECSELANGMSFELSRY